MKHLTAGVIFIAVGFGTAEVLDRLVTVYAPKDATGQPAKKVTPSSPSPELFYKRGDKSGDDGGKSAKDDDSDEKSSTKKGFFARMLGR